MLKYKRGYLSGSLFLFKKDLRSFKNFVNLKYRSVLRLRSRMTAAFKKDLRSFGNFVSLITKNAFEVPEPGDLLYEHSRQLPDDY